MNTYIQSLYSETNANNTGNSDIQVISKENIPIYCHIFILNSSEFFKDYIDSDFYKKNSMLIFLSMLCLLRLSNYI